MRSKIVNTIVLTNTQGENKIQNILAQYRAATKGDQNHGETYWIYSLQPPRNHRV